MYTSVRDQEAFLPTRNRIKQSTAREDCGSFPSCTARATQETNYVISLGECRILKRVFPVQSGVFRAPKCAQNMGR